MFYYPTVLHRNSGCFSTIWLAATKGIKVTRRELLKVNIGRTCSDIMDYVTARVAPLQANLPKPRFSLYLSSQLQYGVVVVYHRQCGFLLEEVQQAIDRLLRSRKGIRIDMAEDDRLTLDLPDILGLMENTEGAVDPFFGKMDSHQLPSPLKTHQPVLVVEEEKEGSGHSMVPGPQTTQDNKSFRSPPAAITLREREPVHITTAECFEGDELSEATAREIDLLLEQPDHFRTEVLELQQRSRDLEGAMSFVDQLKETELGAEDNQWLLDQEAGPVDGPLAAHGLELTPVHVAMPTAPSEASGKESDRATGSSSDEVAAPPLKKPGRGHRRQLVFIDPVVQISDGAMKEQIENPQAETLDLSQVLLNLPSFTHSVAQLFSAPCGFLVNSDLQSLWKQRACLAVQPGQREAAEEARGGTQQDPEILRAERKRRRSSTREISSESGLQLADSSSATDVVLDMSREDKSASDVITPVSRCWISSSLQARGQITFGSLVPPEASRSTAAHTLYQLLELLSAGQVTVKQAEPYATITIKPATVIPLPQELRFISPKTRPVQPEPAPAPEGDNKEPQGEGYIHSFWGDSTQTVKLAADDTQSLLEEGEANVEQADRELDSPAERESPGPCGKLVRVELEWDIPMSLALPVQVQPDPVHHPFPFLDTTLADLGIQESEVKERVVWVDTKKTQVKNKAGKLKEKEITILEVRVKAQKPGDKQLQEVLYSTEAHTDRSFCRTGMNIQPWKTTSPGEDGLTPVQMTMALENQQPDLTETQEQREI
ncbi:uncharacterized protein V6R79_011995 [Siganus canaliculatus]